MSKLSAAKLATAARRRRIAAILARTAASRRELDARAAGADMRSLADLPVCVLGAPRPRETIPIMLTDRYPDKYRVKPPMAPPVAFEVRELGLETRGRKSQGGERERKRRTA